MIEQPKFTGHIQVEVLSPDLVVMASEYESRSLPGRLYPLLVPLIDGRNTVGDIIDGVAGKANALDVRAGLTWLEEDGLIRDANAAPPTLPQLDHLSEAVLPASEIQPLTATVSFLGTFPQGIFHDALTRHGIVVDQRNRSRFGILIVDDYLRDEIHAFNQYALQTGMTWMIARPSTIAPWIGPVFRPGESPCWNCLALRLRENRPIHAFVAERRRRLGSPLRGDGPAPDDATALAMDIVASRIARWAAGAETETLEAGLLAFEDEATALRRHAVVQMPHCDACADPRPLDRAPVPVDRPALDRREPVTPRDGGYRTASAEETVQRLRSLVSPLTGVIGYVERRGTDNVQMVVADHPFRFDRVPHHALRDGGRHKSAGKGLGAAQAEASAMCEAIERYSGIFRGDKARRSARFAEFEDAAIHPDRCLNYSERQYAERDRWNGLGSQKLWVPKRFDPDRPIEWSPAWSLTHDAPRWLPTALCYYGYPQDATHELCPVDSNGNAAGNTLEEAILQGFLELVERDAVALWWYDRSMRPGVALESFPEARLAQSLPAYAALGRDVTVLDITSDFEIPAFAAFSRRLDGPEELLLGFGAHFDADIAIARAVTEMGQFLPAARRGRWRRPFTAPVADDRFLRPDPTCAPRNRADYARPDFPHLGACVERCVAAAAGLGLETLVLDQTRVDVGLPVVKVFVPGLRHFTARLGPGRLYDVPVKLGWRGEPLPEDALNPSHIVI